METKGISKLDLKRRNRKQILYAIRRSGQLARVDIAEQLELTRAAVTIITNQMISQGILEDMNSPAPSDPDSPRRKGRKKTMIRINPTYKYVLGAMVDEDLLSVGLADLANNVISKESLPLTDETDSQEIVSFIVKACKKHIKKNQTDSKRILGLGLGVAPTRWEQMRAEISDNEVQFKKLCFMLEMELGVPVCAANAISLYALASIDHDKNAPVNQLMVYAGSTYHCAAVSGDMLVGGFYANTALVDRMIVCADGAEEEGFPRGSVHTELALPVLRRIAKEATGQDLTREEIHAMYQEGTNEALNEAMDKQLTKLSIMIYNLCITYRSVRVTMQNFQLSERARTVLREKLDALSTTDGRIQLIYSAIEGENAFLAGCSLAQEKQFFELGGMQPGEVANE